jgi:hypothetical protein
MISDDEKAPRRVKRALPRQEVEGLVLDLDFDDLHCNDAACAARSKEQDVE